MKDLKVLVIDPDFDYLQLISQFLATDGFHVVTATDGEEGLRKAMIESPDLILIEPMLSKLHGFTLCNIVSKEFKKKVPVIILTNHYQDARYKKEAIQVYGAAAYLTRPIMKKELRTTIFDVLGKKSMEGVDEKPIPQVPDVKETPKEEPTENIPAEVVSEKASEVVAEEPQEVVEEETVEVTTNSVETPTKSSGNNGNGSNGKSKVDKMLNDIESEFGLLTDKKLANRNQDLQI
ncbi:MAG: response regulator [Candidatus Aminicenantes bacterium]|nr:response regulator [Candidatus Aminicenantes bacterium]